MFFCVFSSTLVTLVTSSNISNMKKIVIASHNQGKIVEIQHLLAPLGIEVLSSNDFNIPEPEETGATFIENAYIKSLAFANATGLPSLSDDSGLMVDILGGRPGIHSARYAENPATGKRDFDYGMKKLEAEVEAQLKKQGLPAELKNQSSAHFICALSLCLPHENGEYKHYEFEGKISGDLTFSPRGKNGFGYDACFTPQGYNQTFGEMQPEFKHSISHRAIAFKKFLEFLR
jgi:XTP/dITP diphosphohydrolase